MLVLILEPITAFRFICTFHPLVFLLHAKPRRFIHDIFFFFLCSGKKSALFDFFVVVVVYAATTTRSFNLTWPVSMP